MPGEAWSRGWTPNGGVRVVRDGANANRAVLADVSIAVIKRIIGESLRVRTPALPDWPALNVRDCHGGNGVVSQFRGGPDACRLRQRGQTFNALTRLPTVASRLSLTLE